MQRARVSDRPQREFDFSQLRLEVSSACSQREFCVVDLINRSKIASHWPKRNIQIEKSLNLQTTVGLCKKVQCIGDCHFQKLKMTPAANDFSSCLGIRRPTTVFKAKSEPSLCSKGIVRRNICVTPLTTSFLHWKNCLKPLTLSSFSRDGSIITNEIQKPSIDELRDFSKKLVLASLAKSRPVRDDPQNLWVKGRRIEILPTGNRKKRVLCNLPKIKSPSSIQHSNEMDIASEPFQLSVGSVMMDESELLHRVNTTSQQFFRRRASIKHSESFDVLSECLKPPWR